MSSGPRSYDEKTAPREDAEQVDVRESGQAEEEELDIVGKQMAEKAEKAKIAKTIDKKAKRAQRAQRAEPAPEA